MSVLHHHSASLGHLFVRRCTVLSQTRRPSRFPIDLPVVLDLIVTVSVVSLVKPLEIPTRRWLSLRFQMSDWLCGSHRSRLGEIPATSAALLMTSTLGVLYSQLIAPATDHSGVEIYIFTSPLETFKFSTQIFSSSLINRAKWPRNPASLCST